MTTAACQLRECSTSAFLLATFRAEVRPSNYAHTYVLTYATVSFSSLHIASSSAGLLVYLLLHHNSSLYDGGAAVRV